ncbi:DMT family transporter [Sandarakinorhabdus sp. DWP1-3-1]|uniref:DMT family transporter n=1 Tax=Sandarakinorhabdus sp. DWP1-3-1 TaxID=2804627 RepID=UPI003CF3B975
MTAAAQIRPAGVFTPRLLVYFAIITFIWGSTWLVIKTQLGVVPASWAVAYRFLLGGSAMMLMVLVRGKSLRIGGAGHRFALVNAVMQFVLNFNLVYRAEEHVTSGLVALSFALLIVPNALLSAAFLGQRITPRFALGSIMGIGGVALIFARDLMAPGLDTRAVALGLALAIGGVLSASVANVMQATSTGRSLPAEGGLAWSMAYGGLLNAGLAWALAGPPVIDTSPAFLLGLAYLGLVASAVAFSLYYAIIRAVGPGKAAYNGVVVPLVAMALSTVFEGYRWTPLAVAGGALAMVGLVVALRSRS